MHSGPRQWQPWWHVHPGCVTSSPITLIKTLEHPGGCSPVACHHLPIHLAVRLNANNSCTSRSHYHTMYKIAVVSSRTKEEAGADVLPEFTVLGRRTAAGGVPLFAVSSGNVSSTGSYLGSR